MLKLLRSMKCKRVCICLRVPRMNLNAHESLSAALSVGLSIYLFFLVLRSLNLMD